MGSCRDIEPLLAAYVDGEAPAGDRAAVEAHLGACASCRDAVSSEGTARDVLSACRDRLRASAPGALHARCAAHAPPAARARPTGPALGGWRTLVPLSVAASLLLAVAGVFVYSAVNQAEALAAQLAADHVKCAKIVSPGPGDPVALAAQWEAVHRWPVRVAASDADLELEFLTIRRCLVTDGQTAHLMYKWRGQPLSVFVLPDTVEAVGRERLLGRFGYDTVMWSHDGRTYVIVADGRAGDVAPVVRYVKAHTH
jgi:anti-sigma factor RsiW